MTRLQLYYRRRAIVEYTFIAIVTIACAVLDGAVLYAWFVG